MKNILLMTWYTLREAFARKVFIFFLGISVLVLIGTAIVFMIVDTNSILNNFLSKENLQFKEVLLSLQLLIVSPLTSLCLLLAIFSSASFIPVMLEKGNIDLLLSKPISRSQLLWGKYFGGILVVFLNIAFLIIGVWLLISIKFSFWDFSFLWIIITVTFVFSVLYALIVFFGVLTKSSIFGMMIAYLIFLIVSPLLLAYVNELHQFIDNDFFDGILRGLYYIIPKTSELVGTITLNLASGSSVENYQPIISSFLFLILMMFLSDFIFRKKDF